MSQTKNHLPIIYNPDNLTKSELIDSFVVRTWEFEEIFGIIKNDEMKFPPQHIIIQGQRGTGKTTLMLRIYYAVKDDENLNKWLIPIKFDEEQYGIRTLTKFWMQVAEYLEDEDDDFAGMLNEMEECEEHKNCEEECFTLLKKKLNENGKKIVIFLDNFGDMVSKFKEKEHQRLREVLISSPELRLVAASSVVLEFTYDYSKPFYEFFKVYNLKKLTRDEVKNLLLKLGESYKSEEIKRIIENEPQRLETLRRLTGGVPRTIVLLYEIFVDNETGSAFKDLETILDRVTPLYIHRMEILPAQQQEIIDIIALNWDAISVKEITAKTDLESKAISAQLRLLEKNNIVVKESTSTKNHFYRLSERFFNVWYLMRYGKRKSKNRVRFLVEFLEEWCSPKQLLESAYTLKNAMKKGSVYEKHALYMTEALARTSLPLEEQDSLIKETRKYLKTKQSELLEELSDSDYEIFEEVLELLKTDNEIIALRKITEIKDKTAPHELIMGNAFIQLKKFNKAEEYFLKAIEAGHIDAMFNLANMYAESKEYDKAEEYYLIVIEAGDSDAMNNLANMYNERKEYDKAEEYYLKAIEAGNSSAMNNLAVMYEERNEYDKAEEYYFKAIDTGDSDAMFNLANMYQERKEYDKAEEYYLKAIEAGHIVAMNNLANMYQERKEYDKAEEYYLKAIETGNSDVMFSLAYMYYERKEYAKAEEYYLKAIDTGNIDAMFSLAYMYYERKEYDKAEEYYLKAIEAGHSSAINNLAVMYAQSKEYEKAEEYYLKAIEAGHSIAMVNLAIIHEERKEYDKAEEYFLKAIEAGNINAMNGLAWLHFTKKERKEEALVLIRNSFAVEKGFENLHTVILVLLWNNEIENAIDVWEKELFIEEYVDKWKKEVTEVLNFFIAKNQYNFIYKLFIENKFDIKEKYKPVYYALLSFMGDKYSDEFKKMGPELEETVNEIIEVIKQYREDYK